MTTAKDTAAAAAAAEKKTAAPAPWFVIDTNAQPDAPRVHTHQIDGRPKNFTFEAGKALEMPAAIAIKFLNDPAFVRVDAKGTEVPYERTPKQPEQLGAGEKMILKDHETIARYDELSTAALVKRVVLLPGGEKFGLGEKKPSHEDMISFLVAFKVASRKANTSKDSDRDAGFDKVAPDADFEDDEDELAA